MSSLPNLKILCEKYNYTCCYCKQKFKLEQLSREHIIPRSRGGSNHIKNIKIACKVCNGNRGNLPLSIFKRLK